MQYETLAAVDLGSNSFHLQIGRVVEDQIYLLDGLREPVRLGAGLTRDKRIDRAAQVRALDALRRFSDRLRGLPAEAVRVVGTNTLRVAKNSRQFLAEAKETLGFPIEVIAGREEARLIYIGVAHGLPLSREKRLVMDIGGGSTEFIIGIGVEPKLMDSLYMGCVSFSLKYFADGKIEKSTFKRAELAARSELQTIVKQYTRHGWAEAVASSGTARSIASILEANGWSEHGITAPGLEKLRSAILKAGEVERVELAGLREDRRSILPGGLAIMCAAFEELGMEHMSVSDAALRQGVLYDLLGRVQKHDMREVTARQFMRRYHVDTAQAQRVAALAARLYRHLHGTEGDPHAAQTLAWAAGLHEIGISIAHNGYHKHSAYVIANADMPGFSRMEQSQLARLVLAHRGKMAKLQDLSPDPGEWDLVFCLRLASLFCRSRTDFDLPRLECELTESGFRLLLPQDLLEERPLSAAALADEADEWRSIGLRLEVKPLRDAASKAA
ncbi:MAG: exopolyphosphatase [Burkholderiales bacterium]|nr:exopolyphosphatase [Burkholderiales bacterium]